MRPLIATLAFFALAPIGFSHGGSYGGGGYGPPDIVPPAPEPVAPTAPDQPSAKSPTLPGQEQDRGGLTPGAQPGQNPALAAAFADDVTSWRYWWYYNSKPYLDLKRTAQARAVITGSDDFFLGTGSGDGVRPDSVLIHDVIVPHLIEALESESSQQVLTSALLSICRLEGNAEYRQQAEATIVELLAHTDLIVVEVAAISLGILGSDTSAVTLAALLADNPQGRKLHGGHAVADRIRAFAAYGLGQIGMRTERVEVQRYIASQLQATFDSSGPTEFDVRIACLLSMGSVPLESDPDYVVPIKTSLNASVCLEAQVEWATRVALDGNLDQFIRAHAPTTLGRLLRHTQPGSHLDQKARVASLLMEALERGSDAPRQFVQSSAIALGQIGDSDNDELDVAIRAALQQAANKASDQAARNFAWISLAQVSARPGTDGTTPAAAETRKALLAAVKRGSTMQKPWAVLAIGVLERSLADAEQPTSGEMAGFLRQTLEQTRSPELTSATVVALGILRDSASEALLIKVLNRTSDSSVRGYVMVSLGLIRARASLPQIEKILVQSKYRPELVETAAVSLALMHDAQLVPKLVEMLESNSSVHAQGAICFSLGNMGDVRAAEALIERSSDAELGAVARGLALEALGLVAERFELPWNTEISVNTNYLANPTSLSNPDIVGVLDLF